MGSLPRSAHRVPGVKPITQKEALRTIRGLGLSANVRDGEYRVSYPRKYGMGRSLTEDRAYYTDDPMDAIGTARMMVGPVQQTPWVKRIRDAVYGKQ